MKILLAAGALALVFVLAITAGRPARPLDDLRWQSGQPYALAPIRPPRSDVPRP